MKRLFRLLSHFLLSRARSIVEWTALLLIGVGLGWWVHPGCGMLAVGAISLGLLVYAHERDMREKPSNA